MNTSFECYSAGTAIDFIEYCDTVSGVPNSVLGRIRDIQMVIPLEFVTERRVRSGVVRVKHVAVK